MRLDFNIAVIDDDLNNSQKSRSINKLLHKIEEHINNKGFSTIFYKYLNMENFIDNVEISDKQHTGRIDLYLSDNNLQGKNQDGIDVYLSLKNTGLICDFILYTRSDIDEIINKLSTDLNTKKDPNLFTRFTFVARPDDPSDLDWHNPIIQTIEHIITTREEINTLRGLFAHVTAKMHQQLKCIPKVAKVLSTLSDYEEDSFAKAIEIARTEKIISTKLKNWLNTQRIRRNEIIHNDEEYDQTIAEYYIPILKAEKISNPKGFYLQDFSELRSMLKGTQELLNTELKI